MMFFKRSLIIIFIILHAISVTSKELIPTDAFLINGVDGLQPSGLAWCDNRLLFISDKHDSTIFELALKDDHQTDALPYLTLNEIPEPPDYDYPFTYSIKRTLHEWLGFGGGMDWEAIACNDKGELFLASEYYFSVLKVNKEGQAQWIIKDLYPLGNKAGVFTTNNAHIEGLTLNDKGMYLAVEREPRALVFYPKDSQSKPGISLQGHESAQGLSLDFSGLDWVNGKLLTLERNHYQVCEREVPSYAVIRCYGYRAVERSQKWGYETGIYGLAEGLVVAGEVLWIIIDNNGDYRLGNEEDNRPMLMKFENPFQ